MERKFPKLEPLPKEETPAPLIIPKREKPAEEPEKTPAVETPAETVTEPVVETSPTEEKTSAEARAEALIMSHTAKIKPKTRSKGPLAIICVLAGLAIAAAILFASGVIKLPTATTGGGGSSEGGSKIPYPEAAKLFCESHEGYDFDYLYGDKDAAPFIGGEELSEYVSGQWSCSTTNRTEEGDAPTFDFIYMALKENYEDIEVLKEVLTALAEYQDVKKNTDEYFLSVAKSTSPYIYLAAYGQAVVEIYADDEATTETILKELNFPDYK